MKFKIENYSLLVLSPTNLHVAQRIAADPKFPDFFLSYMKFKIENYSLLVLSPTNLHAAQRTAAVTRLRDFFGLYEIQN
jgi:hypothetical protein